MYESCKIIMMPKIQALEKQTYLVFLETCVLIAVALAVIYINMDKNNIIL